jgi:hypothetical protein
MSEFTLEQSTNERNVVANALQKQIDQVDNELREHRFKIRSLEGARERLIHVLEDIRGGGSIKKAESRLAWHRRAREVLSNPTKRKTLLRRLKQDGYILTSNALGAWLSRQVKAGRLKRVGHGTYTLPNVC